MTAPSLFDPPAPPSGPTKPGAEAFANTRAAYGAWRATYDGTRVWLFVLQLALGQMRAGSKRISTKALVERVRAELMLEVNNSYAPFIADDLITHDPRLLHLIERRKRRKAG